MARVSFKLVDRGLFHPLLHWTLFCTKSFLQQRVTCQ